MAIPASGTGGSWIVNVLENQLLPIEQIANIPEGIGKFGNSAFAIKRFDRADGRAIHIEVFG